MGDNKQDIETKLDSAIEQFEKRQKRSFWKTTALSTVVIGLIAVLIFLIVNTINSKDEKLSTVNKQVEIEKTKSDGLQSEVRKRDSALMNTNKLIQKIPEANIPDAIKDEVRYTQKTINEILVHRTLAEGDTLYVWAKSGISIRERTNLNSNRVGSVNYGDPVVLDAIFSVGQHVDTLTINESFKFLVKGNWSEVQRGGFIFDGYLSRLPFNKNRQSISRYFDSINKRFKGTISLNYEEMSNEDIKITSKGLNYNELFFLMEYLYKFDEGSQYAADDNKGIYTIINQRYDMVIEGEALGYSVIIRKSNSS